MPDVRAPTAEERTTRWLAGALSTSIPETTGVRPVYAPDGRPLRMSQYDYCRLHRKAKIFRWLGQMRFETFLDVASGFEHFPWLAAERFGVEGFYSDLVHDMTLPLDGTQYGKLDHAVTLKLPVLPFRDEQFDVVLCSEVLEHLVRPVESIAELLRVTRKHLVLTSLEALSTSWWQRWLSHHRVDVRVPHVERNFFLLDEIAALFGPGLQHESLFYDGTLPASAWASATEQAAIYERLTDPEALARAVARSSADGRHGVGGLGVLLVVTKAGVEPPAPPGPTDPALVRWLMERSGYEEEQAAVVLGIWAAIQRDPSKRPPELDPDRPVAPALLARLRCPDCTGPLAREGSGVVCRDCGRRYGGSWGVPMLHYTTPRLAEPPGDVVLERLCSGDPRRRARVRAIMRRLRRNERPAGALRRGLWRLEHALGLRAFGEL